MEPSIFTMIIRGEVPCHKVYEDDRIFAFMDIHPIQPGHVLVVPKVQVDQFQDLPEEGRIQMAGQAGIHLNSAPLPKPTPSTNGGSNGA
jgi:histidine triad (HIT) family protein